MTFSVSSLQLLGVTLWRLSMDMNIHVFRVSLPWSGVSSYVLVGLALVLQKPVFF